MDSTCIYEKNGIPKISRGRARQKQIESLPKDVVKKQVELQKLKNKESARQFRLRRKKQNELKDNFIIQKEQELKKKDNLIKQQENQIKFLSTLLDNGILSKDLQEIKDLKEQLREKDEEIFKLRGELLDNYAFSFT